MTLTQEPTDAAMRSRIVGAYKRGVTVLPGARADEWDWQLGANCRNMDVSIFFPSTGARGGSLSDQERRAKSVCRSCPVIERCRMHAMQVGEPHGIWGGMTSRERALLAFRQVSAKRRGVNA